MIRPITVRHVTEPADTPARLVLGQRANGDLLLSDAQGKLRYYAAEDCILVRVFFDHDETWETFFRTQAAAEHPHG